MEVNCAARTIAKKDAELRKLLEKPDFRSFDKMMRKLIMVRKNGEAKNA
jgi:hypothetical protein